MSLKQILAKYRFGDQLALGGINLSGKEVSFNSTSVNVETIVMGNYKLVRKGYKELRIYITPGLDEGKIKDIDNCVYNIQSEIQGGVSYSKKATSGAQITYATYVSSLGVSMIIIILIFGVIFVYAQIYSSLKEKEKEYGILRALGMSIEGLAKKILMSYIKCMFISFGVDVIIVIIFFRDASAFSNSIIYMLIA